jgi:hypothetical protein
MILYFDLSFVARMFNRFREGASLPAAGASLHASPWSLVPMSWGIYTRPIASCALVALTIAAYARGRIDLLNCCAASCVVFTCLWLVGGSMDRMNVAMIFAIICSATISAKAWHTLTLINFLFQAPLYYAVFKHKQYAFGLDPEMPDAVATAVFLLSYFSVLLLSKSRRSTNQATRMTRPVPDFAQAAC